MAELSSTADVQLSSTADVKVSVDVEAAKQPPAWQVGTQHFLRARITSNGTQGKQRQRQWQCVGCCACCCLVLLTYGIYIGVAIIDLVAAGRALADSDDVEVTAINLTGLCTATQATTANIHFEWEASSSVSIEDTVVRAYDEDRPGVELFELKMDSVTINSGWNDIGVAFAVSPAAPAVLAPALQGLLDRDARLRFEGKLTAKTAAVTGFPVGIDVELKAHIKCGGDWPDECVYVSDDGDVSRLSNATSDEKDATSNSLELLALTVLSPAAAQLGLAALLNVSLGSDLFVTLPATAIDVVWAADRQAARDATAALSFAVDEDVELVGGGTVARVSGGLSAASVAEGAALRQLAHAVLVPEAYNDGDGDGDDAVGGGEDSRNRNAPLQLYVRQAGEAGGCYALQLFEELSPIELPTPLPTVDELVEDADAEADDDADDGGGVSLDTASLTLEGVSQSTLLVRMAASLRSDALLTGALPALALSVEDEEAGVIGGDVMGSLLLGEVAPLSLPSVAMEAALRVEPSLLSLAAAVTPLLRDLQGYDAAALAPHLEGRTAGPLLTATSPPGLAELRLPLSWLLSEAVAEVVFKREDDDGKGDGDGDGNGGGGGGVSELALSVDAIGLVADLDTDLLKAHNPSQVATVALDATISSPPLPDRATIGVGTVTVEVRDGGGAPLMNLTSAALLLSGGGSDGDGVGPPAPLSLSAVLMLGEMYRAADERSGTEGGLELASLSFVGSIALVDGVEAVGGRGTISVSGALLQAYQDALNRTDDGDNVDSGGEADADAPKELSLNVSQPYVSSCSGASLSATLGMVAAFHVRIAALSLTMHDGSDGSDAAVALASVSAPAHDLALDEAVKLRASAELLDGGVDKLEAALQVLLPLPSGATPVGAYAPQHPRASGHPRRHRAHDR